MRITTNPSATVRVIKFIHSGGSVYTSLTLLPLSLLWNKTLALYFMCYESSNPLWAVLWYHSQWPMIPLLSAVSGRTHLSFALCIDLQLCWEASLHFHYLCFQVRFIRARRGGEKGGEREKAKRAWDRKDHRAETGLCVISHIHALAAASGAVGKMLCSDQSDLSTVFEGYVRSL